jgi:hypothetical protein
VLILQLERLLVAVPSCSCVTIHKHYFCSICSCRAPAALLPKPPDALWLPAGSCRAMQHACRHCRTSETLYLKFSVQLACMAVSVVTAPLRRSGSTAISLQKCFGIAQKFVVHAWTCDGMPNKKIPARFVLLVAEMYRASVLSHP